MKPLNGKGILFSEPSYFQKFSEQLESNSKQPYENYTLTGGAGFIASNSLLFAQ